MSVSSAPVPAEERAIPFPIKAEMKKPSQKRGRAWLGWTLVCVVLAMVVSAVVLLARHWPYSEALLTSALQDTFKTQVTIQNFHRFYFPHPGCEADLVTLAGATKSGKPIATVEVLRITGRYSDLLFRPYHLANIELVGLHVRIPAGDERKSVEGAGSGAEPSKISIGAVTANGAVLEFEKENEQEPMRFDIHTLRVGSIAATTPMTYEVKMTIPEPPGELESTGKFGPWKAGEVGKTLLRGAATLHRAKLDKYPGIGGTLDSYNNFSGMLEQVEVIGSANVGDFHLKSPGHAERLSAQYIVAVNALKGEARLRNVTAKLGQTSLQVEGSVGKNPKVGKRETSLSFTIPHGRTEDLLWLFSGAAKPTMMGSVNSWGRVTVPKFGEGFVKDLVLTGRFEVENGRFQKATQVKANLLSARAQGKKVADASDAPEVAVTSLSSDVRIEQGVANFTRLYFELPGARARVEGTYGLSSHQVDLRGNLWTDATVSKDTSGIAATLLKPFDPLFKRKHAGAEVAVVMNGDIDAPHFGTILAKDKKGWKGKPEAGGDGGVTQ